MKCLWKKAQNTSMSENQLVEEIVGKMQHLSLEQQREVLQFVERLNAEVSPHQTTNGGRKSAN